MTQPTRILRTRLIISGLVCCGVVPYAWAHQSAKAEPQAPSDERQAARDLVPPLPVPRLVKFAGILKDEQGQPRTGTVGVTFAIYKEQEGGAALWMETQNVELDEQGRYTVLLGATKSEGLPLELFSAGEPRWLGMQVNLPHEVEQARVLLVSVPYALKAADADTLGGKPLSSFVLANAATGASGGTVVPTTASGGIGPTIGGGGSANVVAKFDATGANVINSSLTDNGTVVSTLEPVGVGTSTPQAQLDVEVTTSAPANAVLSNITLNNSAPITNAVVSALDMNFADNSTAANLSKQAARFVYLRNAAATGGVTAFDAVMTATSFLSGNAPYQLRGVNIEGPTINAGKTLSNFTGLYIGSPGGGGTVTTANALVTEPNAGNVGIGTTTPGQKLEVVGNLKVSGAGNALVFPDGTSQTTAGHAGTITAVNTPSGSGLTGGATSGAANLSLINTCAGGQVLQWSGMAWVCASVGGTITAVNTPSGSGLMGGATSGAANLSLISTCGVGQVLQWSGTAWVCASVGGTGTVTSVGSGLGLTGGPIMTAGTLAIDPTVVPQLAASPLVATVPANTSITNGTCITLKVAAPGVTTSMVAIISPSGDPAANGLPEVLWSAFVDSAGSVTAEICKFSNLTTAKAISNQNFNIRVIK